MKKMSPLDIYNEEFSKTTFGGYSTSEVNTFQEEVGMAYEKLLKEINNLNDENDKLKEKLKNYENIEDKLKETLNSVQETVREQTKQAQREAERIIEQANMEADMIIKETKIKLKEEYRALDRLREAKELFKIRYRNILESHLQMLDEEEDKIVEFEEDEINMDDFADNNLDE